MAKQKKKEEMLLELDGSINIILKKNGKIVSKEPLDGEVCLEAILYVLKEGLNK